MSAKLIAYSGVHGTGKTTAVYQAAANYKKQGANVGIILETARKCPLPVLSARCDNPSIEAQQWIFSNQLREEIEASIYYDVIITDRTIVDCIAYTRHFGYHGISLAMESMAKFHNYTEIHFKTILMNDFCHDDGFRFTKDQECRVDIERTMINIYRNIGFDFILE